MAGLKKELSSAVVALEKGIDDNAKRVELRLKSEFNVFENRMSDKVVSLEKELHKETKTCNLENNCKSGEQI